MPRRDIHLNLNGDIEIGYDGDLRIDIDDDVLVKDIIFRLKTYRGDYELEPACGASLEDLIGEPNIRETGESAVSRVRQALTHDGLVASEDLKIRAVPINVDTLVLEILVAGERGNFNITAALDLKTGLLNVRT